MLFQRIRCQTAPPLCTPSLLALVGLVVGGAWLATDAAAVEGAFHFANRTCNAVELEGARSEWRALLTSGGDANGGGKPKAGDVGGAYGELQLLLNARMLDSGLPLFSRLRGPEWELSFIPDNDKARLKISVLDLQLPIETVFDKCAEVRLSESVAVAFCAKCKAHRDLWINFLTEARLRAELNSNEGATARGSRRGLLSSGSTGADRGFLPIFPVEVAVEEGEIFEVEELMTEAERKAEREKERKKKAARAKRLAREAEKEEEMANAQADAQAPKGIRIHFVADTNGDLPSLMLDNLDVTKLLDEKQKEKEKAFAEANKPFPDPAQAAAMEAIENKRTDTLADRQAKARAREGMSQADVAIDKILLPPLIPSEEDQLEDLADLFDAENPPENYEPPNIPVELLPALRAAARVAKNPVKVRSTYAGYAFAR